MERNDNYAQFENIGMNRMASPFNSRKGEWRMVLNGDIDKIGVVSARKGYKLVHTSLSSEIVSIIPYEINNAGRLLVTTANGNAYTTNNPTVGSGTFGAAIATGLASPTNRWGYATLNGRQYIGNGAQSYSFNGTAFTPVSGMPIFRYATVYLQRLYCAGVNVSPTTLFWSTTGDGSNWSSVSPNDSGSTDIEKDWKGHILGIVASNDRVVIFKEKMIKRWDTDYMKMVMDSDGLRAPNSVAEIGGMIFYLTQDGINVYDGEAPQEISFAIQDIIKGIDFSQGNIQRICGCAYEKKYYLNVGDVTLDDGTTIKNTMIVYNFRNNSFSVYSLSHKMTAMGKLTRTDGQEKMYCGDFNGNVYEMWTGDDDNGEAYEFTVESNIVYPYDGGYTVNPRMLTVVCDAPNGLKVKIAPPRGEFIDLTTVYGNVSNIPCGEMVDVNGFRLQFSQSARGLPELIGWSMDYTLGDKRNT